MTNTTLGQVTPGNRKEQIAMTVGKTDMRALDKKVEAMSKSTGKTVSRSELVNEAVKKIVADPWTLIAVLGKLMTREASQDDFKLKTTVMVDYGLIDHIDTAAERMRTTRNTLMNVIAAGIAADMFD